MGPAHPASPVADTVAMDVVPAVPLEPTFETVGLKDRQRGATARPELPRELLDFSMPVVSGRTIVVPRGGNLQKALHSAKRGDEIVLTAGATYTGNFVLPTKPGTSADGWIVIRSDQSGQLPAMGTRVSPSHASLMAKIVTPDVSPAIKTSGAASGWWLTGIEITVSPALTAQQYGLLTLGESGSPQTTLATVPQDLVLDRMYIHGQTTTNLSRCVALNSGRTQVSDSYLSECHGKDFDAQAIAGWNGPGPYKIVNNMLMGSAENLIFGGADPAIPNLIPSDIEIRRNHLYTPLAWKGVWLKKNLLELKNATRVLIEGNVMDGSWTHGQTGWAVVLMATNQSGACRWCSTSDITIRRNLIRNAGAGINVVPRYNSDSVTSRVLISENVLDNIGVSPYVGDQRGFQLLPKTSHVTIERTVLSGRLAAALVLEGGEPGTFRNNVWVRGMYGVIGASKSPGTPTIRYYAPNATWSNMTFVGTSNGPYPPGTRWVGVESGAPLAAQIRAVVRNAAAGVVVP
jgi:Right handed beta helix region